LSSNSDEASLKEALKQWVLTCGVAHNHCDVLLHILHKHHPDLPVTTRSLLGTSRETVQLVEMLPGNYHHFGVEDGIKHAMDSNGLRAEGNRTLEIFIGVDGVSISKSSTSQFYIVAGCLLNFSTYPIFIIGAYLGSSKPASNELLRATIDEGEQLYNEGLSWKGLHLKLKIRAFICDAPCRAMIAYVKAHSSELDGCSKCCGHGVSEGQARTNQSFREKTSPHHHHGVSILERLSYFDCVQDIPLDPMHLLDQGIMKRLLNAWFGTEKKKKKRRSSFIRFNDAIIRQIDCSLRHFKKWISRKDFARQPRSVKEMPRWKATELRMILRYTGVVLFDRTLPSKNYKHFLVLHVAVKLLPSELWCKEDNSFANDLLRRFVVQSEQLYGKSFVSYNVHALLHVADDVNRFGPLDRYSAYRFENFYGHVFSLVKDSSRPLQQLVKRIDEHRTNAYLARPLVSASENAKLKYPHSDGPLIDGVCGTQYHVAIFQSFTISTKIPDNCVYMSETCIVVIRNVITDLLGKTMIIGQEYLEPEDYYKFPVPSSAIYEYLVHHAKLSPVIRAWDASRIKWKAVRMPTCSKEESFFVLPLMMQK
jgi:hypothetical protein